jgi:hypothetical protein
MYTAEVRRRNLAIPLVLVAACASATAQNVDLYWQKTITPGDLNFVGRSGTAYSSRGRADLFAGSISILSGPSSTEPWPLVNPQGWTVGSATYLGCSTQNQILSFNYQVSSNPSPDTRMQYSYDFVPPVQATDHLHLPFSAGIASTLAPGSLAQVEIILAGNWTLGNTTGGLDRTIMLSSPANPWNIVEDFVFHPATNQTRFHATRVGTGVGPSEGISVSGYLVGNAAPSPGAPSALIAAAATVLPRRRRP